MCSSFKKRASATRGYHLCSTCPVGKAELSLDAVASAFQTPIPHMRIRHQLFSIDLLAAVSAETDPKPAKQTVAVINLYSTNLNFLLFSS